MMKTVPVDITIRDNKTGAYLRIPVLPEEVTYNDGDKQATTVRILNLGAVDFPDGVELDEITWDSFFPGRYDPGYCTHEGIMQPTAYRSQFSTWKDTGASLQVVCPAFGINKTMYLKSFKWKGQGFEGDIYYSVTFKEEKTVKPKQLTPAGTAPPKGKKDHKDRPPAPKKDKPKTYTVVSGDYAVKIAKKLGLPDWRALYQKNKAVIGPNPDKIKPGMVLKV